MRRLLLVVALIPCVAVDPTAFLPRCNETTSCKCNTKKKPDSVSKKSYSKGDYLNESMRKFCVEACVSRKCHMYEVTREGNTVRCNLYDALQADEKTYKAITWKKNDWTQCYHRNKVVPYVSDQSPVEGDNQLIWLVAGGCGVVGIVGLFVAIYFLRHYRVSNANAQKTLGEEPDASVLTRNFSQCTGLSDISDSTGQTPVTSNGKKPSSGSSRPEKPSTGSSRREKPSTGSSHPEKPSTGSSHPEKPSTGSNHPEKPSTGSSRREKPSTGSNHPEKPSTGSNHPEKPSSLSNRPEKPSSLSNRPRERAATSTKKVPALHSSSSENPNASVRLRQESDRATQRRRRPEGDWVTAIYAAPRQRSHRY